MHLIICIHNHQPVGNMDFILEDAYEKAYRPFFEVMDEFTDIRISLHFSGYLLSWLNQNKPEYIKLLKKLIKKGRVEIVSGGMYEPILSFLPEDDGVSQIVMHMDYAEKLFGVRPKGMWLAERVYEPHMPKIINKANILYTLVDDNHFKSVGVADKDLYGYFITEYEGNKLFIFPGLESLRYAIPFKPIEEIDEYFKSVEERKGDLAVFGDDGEKFGLWPGTYDHVYTNGWLKSFFKYLEENKSWLKTTTFSEYMSNKPPKGRIYLSCNSYKEMAEWCLPACVSGRYDESINCVEERYKDFLKGGYFKYFLIKYDESNDMHKKMLNVTQKAGRHAEARKHVFMGQSNDSYWHGVFGGLYLPHLRASVYEHLIEAEKLLESKKPFAECILKDINMDGHDEVILNNNDIKACFFLKEGGVLYELDYKPSSVNIMATLQRRYEGYHDKIKAAASAEIADGTKTIHDMVITKEEGLDAYLHYDWYRRASFIDHIMGKDVEFDSFYRSDYLEPGNFVKEPYGASIKKKKDYIRLSMERKGRFRKNGQDTELIIKKGIIFGKGEDAIFAEYLIEGDVYEPFYLGVEFNFSFLGTGGERYAEIGGERIPLTTHGVLKPSRSVLFHDPYQHINVSLEFDDPSAIWTHPVEVISLSESGFERNYQSTMFMPVWNIDLSKGPQKIMIKLQLNKS
jgi:4-alpha-glucanotransferase